ncbi:MAG: asparagine synthase (glutamine-hydrolyzing) [Microthrixaceae bacterium]
MCGIVGMLLRDGLSSEDLREVASLTDLMKRRGPDDSGSWNDAESCALGFRRLSIIDLSQRGHQPMVTEDGQNVLVFNGEVYNFRELRTELIALGRSFRSESDTEVVLQSLAQWGADALSRFNGMFALAWYRPAIKTLLLARDPVGIKPLYWWRSSEAFVFGSQYDQVIRHRRCDRTQVDPGALNMYLRLGYLPGRYALLSDTGQVPPGYVLEIQSGGQQTLRRFRPAFAAAAPRERLRGQAALEAVAQGVADAVQRQRVSDVEVGAFLSGGVDSPLVTAHLQAATDHRVPAFTIGTDDPVSDESEAAQAYADILGVDFNLRRIDGAAAVSLVDDVAAANTEPFGDYSSFPTLLVAKLAAESVKTVQSGDGGDELFWGYPRFSKVAQAAKWFALPRSLRVTAYGATKPLPNPKRPPRGVMFPSLGDWYLDAHSGLRGADFDCFAPELGQLPHDFDLFTLTGRPSSDELFQWMRANELACHLPMVLQKVDRAAMFHSLEVRVPLLDLELLDLAQRIDPEDCMHNGLGKLPLRHALGQQVPPESIPIPKKGFTVPMAQWLRTDLRGHVEALLLERDPFPHGFFDRSQLSAWCEDHFSGRLDRHRGLWNLLALQLWADAHVQPLPTAPKVL